MNYLLQQRNEPQWLDGTPPVYDHLFNVKKDDASHLWQRSCQKVPGGKQIDKTNITQTYGKYMFSSSQSKNNCTGLLLQTDGSSLGWIRIPCKTKFNASFVCTKVRNTSLDIISDAMVSYHSETCKDGWILMKGYCYLIIKPYVGEISAFDGMRICSLHNATFPVTHYLYDKHIMPARQKKIYEALMYDYSQYRFARITESVTEEGIPDFPSTDVFEEIRESVNFIPYGKYPIQRQLESTILELLDILYYYEPRDDWRNVAVWTSSSIVPCLYVEIPIIILRQLVISDDTIKRIRNPWLAEDLGCNRVMPVNYLICTASPELVVNKRDKCKGDHFLCQDGACILSEYGRDGITDCTSGDDAHTMVRSSNNDTNNFVVENCHEYICTPLDKRVISSSMCIPYHAICDGISQCPNNDDEQPCPTKEQDEHSSLKTGFSSKVSPCTIGNQSSLLCQYDRNFKPMFGDCHSFDLLSQCENVGCSRKFKCYNSYCISVDKVCDGIVDCLGGDDEINCENYVCVGMLRCRGERLCVGTWQICDGVPQCKTYDDEVNCESCPDNCLCSGHVIICDVYSTDWSLIVSDSFKVIIMKGFIADISFMRMYKIAKVLDISNCNITYLSERDSLGMNHAFILYAYLNNNGLKSLLDFNISIFVDIFLLNISHNQVINLDGIHYQKLYILDASYNSLTYISTRMSLPVTEYINVKGNNLLHIENRVLGIIPRLKLLTVSDYMIYCSLNLSIECNYEGSYMCPRIIEFYQKITLLCLAIFNFAAGFMPLYYKQIRQKDQRGRPHDMGTVIINNLSFSCLVVSFYVSIIVAADTYYAQNYMQFYKSWLSSAFCKLSAVISIAANVSCLLLGCVRMIYILIKTIYPFKQLVQKLPLICIMVWLFLITTILPLSIVNYRLFNNLSHSRFAFCLGITQMGGHFDAIMICPAALALLCQSACYYVVYRVSEKSANVSGYKLSRKRKLKFVRVAIISVLPDLFLIMTYGYSALEKHNHLNILLYLFTVFPLSKLTSTCFNNRKSS